METRKYLTEKETASMLSVSVYTLRAYRQKTSEFRMLRLEGLSCMRCPMSLLL